MAREREKKSPAFQFYPRDFLTDANVTLMSNSEIGIYLRLLCHCWLERGLQNDTTRLAGLARVPVKQFTKLWAKSVLRSCFQVGEDGRLHNPRLNKEREKQVSFQRRQSDAGKASAAARATGSGSTVVQPDVNQETISLVEPQLNPRVADRKESLRISGKGSGENPTDESERAGALLERYHLEWFPKFRKGARLPLIANSLQFDDALALVRTWDDARLEKLAAIVLTTDEDWIAKTDRSFKIFKLRAGWADDRLRQAEVGVA